MRLGFSILALKYSKIEFNNLAAKKIEGSRFETLLFKPNIYWGFVKAYPTPPQLYRSYLFLQFDFLRNSNKLFLREL